LLFAYPLALFLRRRRFGTRIINSVIKVPLFVPALVAAFLILNVLAFNGVLNSVLMGLGIIDEPLRLLNDRFGWNVFIIRYGKTCRLNCSLFQPRCRPFADGCRRMRPAISAPARCRSSGVLFALSVPGIPIAVVLVFIHLGLRHHTGCGACLSVFALGSHVRRLSPCSSGAAPASAW
jgi:putative spermidine/putrescine transport system permease protein